MKRFRIDRRMLVFAGASALLAGCTVIPKGAGTAPAPAPTPTPEPSASTLPADQTRHRIALLVPMSGSNAAVGQSIANATTMALLDTNASNLRITTYDTATGAKSAAARAIADGNKLILGPLLADDVGAILSEARPASVPLIAFSNDTTVAGADVFVMGHIPAQSIDRTVRFARARGAVNFAALIPDGEYGTIARSALQQSVSSAGGRVVATEAYARGNTSIISAAQRLRSKDGYDAVLIPDGARLAAVGAAELRTAGAAPRILGTELWSGENLVAGSAGLRGALFAAVSDGRYKRFTDSYTSRFASQPYRISTLGYDAVLLTLRIAQGWKIGTAFPTARLRDAGGFLGLDGPFRFMRSGIVERAMEVREVRNGEVVVVDPAPARFAD